MRTHTETNVNDQNVETYIGVDVAKETLDAYRTHDKVTKQFPNSKEGFKQFLKWCKGTPPTLVLCEEWFDRGGVQVPRTPFYLFCSDTS